MALADLPKTLAWEGAKAGWVPSALTATGLDEAAAHLVLIDQRALPHSFQRVSCFTSGDVCDAIADLTVRGAPAIGISGAYAMVLWARNEWPLTPEGKADGTACGAAFLDAFKQRAEAVAATRPTAVNLSWAVGQLVACAEEHAGAGEPLAAVVRRLERRAGDIAALDEASSKLIGSRGADIFQQLAEQLGRPINVQTHCNAGSLGTVRLGTATAAIYEAHERGLIANVWVDETRPVDQGARLTTWEMAQVGVPYTLICDDMAGAVMAQGKVDAVIVGADRVCANGDVANKIGTYQLAVLARYHGIPFYVAAPHTTLDDSLACGEQIVIEQRSAQEVRCMPSGREWLPVALQDAPVYNPAFDVTPAELVTALITD